MKAARDTRSILVVGGGIGGLTAAAAFCQDGRSVDLVEVAGDLSVYGVGIIQPNNVLRALERIGVAQQCLDAGFAFPGWRLADANGDLLAELPQSNAGAPHLPPINGISRPDLHTILVKAATDAGATIRLNTTFESYQEQEDGVLVTFRDGSTSVYDLVVASDGLYSASRKALFPDEARPTFNGQGVWRYNFKRPKDLDWGYLFYGKSSKAGLVPMSDDMMYMLLVTAEPGNPKMRCPNIDELLRERLAEYGGIVGELAAQITDPRQVVYRPMEPMLQPLPWNKGRVVIIGDAVHGTTPHLAQGAAIAVEDAVVLAEMLADAGPIDSVLAGFGERRFQRCKKIVDVSGQLGAWEVAEWAGNPDPDANPAALMDGVWAEMAEPF